MFFNKEVAEQLAADRRIALACEIAARAASRPAHDRDGLLHRLVRRARSHRSAGATQVGPSPWLWTRALDLGNCDSGRGMPW